MARRGLTWANRRTPFTGLICRFAAMSMAEVSQHPQMDTRHRATDITLRSCVALLERRIQSARGWTTPEGFVPQLEHVVLNPPPIKIDFLLPLPETHKLNVEPLRRAVNRHRLVCELRCEERLRSG
jgi:hypothetical protein